MGISDSALSVGCADSSPRGRAKAMQDRQSPRNDRYWTEGGGSKPPPSAAFRSSACHSEERSDVGISDPQLSFRGNEQSEMTVGISIHFCSYLRLPRQAKAFLAMTDAVSDCVCLAMTGADRDLYRREQAPALLRYKDGSRKFVLSLSQLALRPDSSLPEGAFGLAMIRDVIHAGGQ